MLNEITKVLKDVRAKTPLIQAITNYVTINDCANMLLCFGASPAMCEAKEEVEEFVNLISALYINVGTLTKEQEESAMIAVAKAAQLNKPVVLDPVACGAISRKTTVVKKLLECGKISVIKGNVGEIKALAGFSGMMRGVDSIDDGEDVVEACKELAKNYNTVVVATGITDVITDGTRTCLVENGTNMLTLVTGAGCMAGALTASTAAVCEDKVAASLAAITAMSLAGEMAAATMGRVLPGTFKTKLFDFIYCMTEEDILKGGKIKCF
jgi:hydroxyethylthiazole kinase